LCIKLGDQPRVKKVLRFYTQRWKWLSPVVILKSLNFTDRAMAQAISRRPFTAEARIHPITGHLELKVGKVLLGQLLYRVFQSSVGVIAPFAP
jgi:hypothetical protein